MATNRYAGYCEDCGREVRANHGELVKRGSKWVVSCGRKKTASVATEAAKKQNIVAPEGMRISNLKLGSANASLEVRFSLDGTGSAEWFPGYDTGRLINYGTNAELIARLKEQGQLTEGKYESTFPVSAEEKAALTQFVADAEAKLLSAILDGSAEIEVLEVGCDFPHPQLCGVKVNGEKTEYSLIQDLLRRFNLAVDSDAVCEDVAKAIRDRQAVGIERAAKLAAHKARRAEGFHVVLIRRCWECGRTQILGEYDDEMHVVKMPCDVYEACNQERQQAQVRSIEGVTEPISSVGFAPAAESKFDFRIDGENWYCGC